MNREDALNWCADNLAEWPNNSDCIPPEGWVWVWKYPLSLTPVLKALEGSYEYIDVNDYLDAPTKFKHTATILITPQQQISIDYVMDCFYFRRVDKVMRKLKWKWVQSELNHDDTGTPTELALRVRARQTLINSIAVGNASSSGFEATYDKSTSVFILKFILTDWHSYEEG